MTIHMRFTDDYRFLISHCYDLVEVWDLYPFYQAALRNMPIGTAYRELCVVDRDARFQQFDYTKVDAYLRKTGKLFEAREITTERVAWVSGNRATRYFIEMWEAAAKTHNPPGLEWRFFDDVQTACTWLNLDLETYFAVRDSIEFKNTPPPDDNI